MRRGQPGRRAPLRVVVASVGDPSSARARAGLARWLERQAPRAACGLVAIALVSDVEMRRLNRTYRGLDRPTDVLSFPAYGAPALSPKPRVLSPKPRALSPKPVNHLGDIAIARGVAARQARRLGHSYRIELRVLALHGLLHLLGYDHERDQGTMRQLEERMRRRAGLPSGLIARVGRRGPIDR
jgi:probable rRNA maturation factor